MFDIIAYVLWEVKQVLLDRPPPLFVRLSLPGDHFSGQHGSLLRELFDVVMIQPATSVEGAIYVGRSGAGRLRLRTRSTIITTCALNGYITEEERGSSLSLLFSFRGPPFSPRFFFLALPGYY